MKTINSGIFTSLLMTISLPCQASDLTKLCFEKTIQDKNIYSKAEEFFKGTKAISPECHPSNKNAVIIIDLGQDGIQLGPAGTGVFFDLNDDGHSEYIQWTALYGDEAFLVLDKNGNGIVDDGSELFSNFNPLVLDEAVSPNGFADLAQYDRIGLGGNDDGFITPADETWGQLKLWRDSNADGISTQNEMLNPADFSIIHFNTIPRVINRHDNAGNSLTLWGWAQKKPKSNHNRNTYMVEVFFKSLLE